MSYVRLSKKSAQALLRLVEDSSPSADNLNAMSELIRVLAARKPKPMAVERKRAKAAKKATKREQRAEIRAAVESRASGACECMCGRLFRFSGPAHWDHFFGRARAESVETTWMLAPECDGAKTLNLPSAREWIERFIGHCDRYGYEAERARARLEGIVAVRDAAAVWVRR